MPGKLTKSSPVVRNMDPEESISESGGLTGNWNGPRLASEAEVDEIDFDKIVDVDADDEGEVSRNVFTNFFGYTKISRPWSDLKKEDWDAFFLSNRKVQF